MPLRRHPNRISRKNHHTSRSGTARSQSHQLLVKNQISPIEETSPEIHWIHQLLQKLHNATVRKDDWNVRTPKSRLKNHHIRRTSRQLQSHQRKPSRSMWTSPQTTCRGKTIRTNDKRKLPSIRLRPNDRRKRRQKTTLQTKPFAPVAFGSRVFCPSQLKMSIYCTEFLAIYHAFLEYSHILWETTLPTLVLTDNRSETRFFQTKTTPPALWNACDCVLRFKFRIMHVAGSQNTAADFLSRLELKELFSRTFLSRQKKKFNSSYETTL